MNGVGLLICRRQKEARLLLFKQRSRTVKTVDQIGCSLCTDCGIGLVNVCLRPHCE